MAERTLVFCSSKCSVFEKVNAWIIQFSLELDMVMNSPFLNVAACILVHRWE